MIRPSHLSAGDKIAIVAPARKIEEQQIADAIHSFQSWGLQVQLGKNIFSNNHSYLSGNDNERLEDFQNAIDDPEVKMIIAARGGYGAGRIIDQLNLNALETYPKWIVGFSDITAVHLKLFSKNLMSIHGTMPILFSKSDSKESIESLRQLLFGEHQSIFLNPHFANKTGVANGRLVGGNLSLIIDSLGTDSELNTNDCILIIEEIDEYVYRLDRMLNHLKRARKLNNLKGLIIGHMTDIKQSELRFAESIEEIVHRVTEGLNFPIAFGFPSGHENPNLAWIHGEYYELKIQADQVVLQTRSLAL